MVPAVAIHTKEEEWESAAAERFVSHVNAGVQAGKALQREPRPTHAETQSRKSRAA
jgi:hypothetical protein